MGAQAMGFGRYLKDRIWLIVIGLLVVASVALMLWVLALDGAAIAFLCAILVASAFVLLLLDYGRKRRFYHSLQDTLEHLEEAYLVTELVDRPSFAEGEICYDALARATKAMNDKLGEYQQASREYREYIEAWIHEVKTPIASAHLYRANHESADSAALDSDIERIEAYVEQALYYSRGTALEKDYSIRQLNLEDLVKDVLRRQARPLIDSGVSPRLGDLDFIVQADEKWLVFVLGQIVSNAVKYHRGTDGTEPPCISFAARSEETGLYTHAVHLSIVDNGVGIPEQDVSRVFDKGFTGENGRRFSKSTGIGLYLCRQLCDKMGLAIGLDSEEGVGTAVSIVFPVSSLHSIS